MPYSYIYDVETGLYYLQSRYYNPKTGRFLNSDSQITTSLGLLGYNMYPYCLNNPINKVDYSGNKPGDLFDTMDEAAIDAAKYLGALSWETGWEYSTCFYTKNILTVEVISIKTTHHFLFFTRETTTFVPILVLKTKYTYTNVRTDQDSFKVYFPNAPRFKKRLGVLHTHPYGSWLGKTKFSDGDIEWADESGIPMYVHGPDGQLKKYDPETKTRVPIDSSLPLSPVQPWLD